ncbi:hypothetical protein ACFV1N_13115 [Streptosporangium canum]|uniref:hypothetical protein n=1 Tax=Streptosporangium canum TaxID=324952 RepID=UPI00369D35A6
MALDPVYDLEEAAAYLKVTPHWLKVHARRNHWGTKLGRKRVFTETHLAEILANGSEQPPQIRPARIPHTRDVKPCTPKATPVDKSATLLRARPEAARSYGKQVAS